MKKKLLLSLAVGSVALLSSGLSHAIVDGDLLTGNTVTTDWQNCAGSDLIQEEGDNFDPEHLEGSGCAYRETAVTAGESYILTCGISSSKYSSITLAFHDAAGATIATETTEIYEDVQGGAYSVTLEAPADTSFAAVGIYGLAGSGFQDCSLLLENPPVEPVYGSISGITWYDEDENSIRANTESRISGTSVSIFSQTGDLIKQATTNINGRYRFGGLDLDQCYTVKFQPVNDTLEFTAFTEDSTVADLVTGSTLDICLSDDSRNITNIHAGYVNVVIVDPEPEDYAICGAVYASRDGTLSGLDSTTVLLRDVGTNEVVQKTESADGVYRIGELPAGDYYLEFVAPGGFVFVEQGTPLSAVGSYTDLDGISPRFNLPAASNTIDGDACTLDNANAILAVEILELTVAENDEGHGVVGTALEINAVENDSACNGGNDQVVTILGHDFPHTASVTQVNGVFTIDGVTEAGTYSIQYQLRGSCGSADEAEIIVEIEDLVDTTVPAPMSCVRALGNATTNESSYHIDIRYVGDENFASLADEYRFYDADENLVYTGLKSEASSVSWGLMWKKYRFNVDVLAIRFATAVVGGEESAMTTCSTISVTPIALDTDSSGGVERISGKFSFDINGDGFDEDLLHWFSPTDGILITKDFGTKISGNHLFGDTGRKFADGFAKLALEDVNGDGQLMGQELSKLAIWTDINSNTMVDEGEISSLESHSIEQLSVEHYKYASRATLDNGKTMLMRDLWFAINPIKQASK
jgi:hypothetical protein